MFRILGSSVLSFVVFYPAVFCCGVVVNKQFNILFLLDPLTDTIYSIDNRVLNDMHVSLYSKPAGDRVSDHGTISERNKKNQ